MTRHPEFTIESPHLDKFLLQPKATARQPQISSLSTSLDCTLFFQANTIHNFSFSCKANTNQSFFSCESNPVHTTSFLLLSFKADLLSFKLKKQKQKANKHFIFLSKAISKQFKKAIFFNFQTAISKVLRPKRKSNLTKALFFSFKKLSFFFPPLLIKIFLPNTALRRQKDLTAVIKYETNISYRNHIFYRPQEHQDVCFPEQHA